MLYKITVYEVRGNKKVRIYTVEVEGVNPAEALTRGCVRIGGARLCEIQEVKRVGCTIYETAMLAGLKVSATAKTHSTKHDRHMEQKSLRKG